MHPDVFTWGLIHVRSYGLMLAVAFLVGTWIALKEARRLGLDEDRVITVILATLVFSVLGARAMYVLEHIDEFRHEWGSVLALWQGGLTLYGGMVGGTVAGLWTAKRVGLAPWSVADATAPSVALGNLFGRVGCFLNGCCYGRPTKLPWGVTYPRDSFPYAEFGPVPIHPAQLYFAAAGLGMFAILWSLRRRLTVPGHLFWTFIAMFALVRIPLDFTRAYDPGSVVGHLGSLDVTESQLTSLALAMFGVLMILRLKRRAPAAAASPAAATEPATPRPPA